MLFVKCVFESHSALGNRQVYVDNLHSYLSSVHAALLIMRMNILGGNYSNSSAVDSAMRDVLTPSCDKQYEDVAIRYNFKKRKKKGQ